MTEAKLKKEIQKIPEKPGIYLFKKSGNKPLYIGKALNLKNRLKSYLKNGDSRIKQMVSEATKINCVETRNEIEALILESQYIKKYRPEFNIVLRDDKQYSFVIFTHLTNSGQTEKYPKIFITHQPQKYQETIGPFTDAGALKITLRLLRRIFPYCTCTQKHNNYCLNYHINKCPGFCCLKNNDRQIISGDQKEYKKNIEAIKDILSGKKNSLIKQLREEMKNLSKKEEYEKAIELKNKLEKVERVFENVRVINNSNDIGIYHNNKNLALKLIKRILRLPQIPNRIECYDIANIQGEHAVGAMAVFTSGQPDKNEYRKFKIYTGNTPNDTAMLREILTRRLKHSEWPYPDLIIVDGGKGQLNIIKEILNTQYPVLRMGIMALTKNDKHMGHKITLANKEILLSKLPPEVKNLLLQIDSEAHRFAISYYRKLHRKKALRP